LEIISTDNHLVTHTALKGTQSTDLLTQTTKNQPQASSFLHPLTDSSGKRNSAPSMPASRCQYQLFIRPFCQKLQQAHGKTETVKTYDTNSFILLALTRLYGGGFRSSWGSSEQFVRDDCHCLKATVASLTAGNNHKTITIIIYKTDM